jgi:hypothetical protein
MNNMPTTRQETKKIEEEEGLLEETSEEEEVSPGGEEDMGSESSEDPNFELPDSLLEMEEEDDLFDILNTFFTTEDGDNVCTALMGIKDAMDTQNKILLKMCMSLTKKK